MPVSKDHPFANDAARDKYIRKLLRQQRRLLEGKTIKADKGFTLDPKTLERVESGEYQPESKFSRIKHGKQTTQRFAKS